MNNTIINVITILAKCDTLNKSKNKKSNTANIVYAIKTEPIDSFVISILLEIK